MRGGRSRTPAPSSESPWSDEIQSSSAMDGV